MNACRSLVEISILEERHIQSGVRFFVSKPSNFAVKKSRFALGLETSGKQQYAKILFTDISVEVK